MTDMEKNMGYNENEISDEELDAVTGGIGTDVPTVRVDGRISSKFNGGSQPVEQKKVIVNRYNEVLEKINSMQNRPTVEPIKVDSTRFEMP